MNAVKRVTMLTLAIALGAASVIGCAANGNSEHRAIITEQLEPYELGTIAQLHACQGVFLASQPSTEDFRRVNEAGFKSVVNMRYESENKDFDERSTVETLGLIYENPAWNGPDELTDDMIETNLDLIRNTPRPMLVHCGSSNRVGAIWYAYRVIDGGLSRTDALAEAKVVGMKTPAYETTINAYLDRHGH